MVIFPVQIPFQADSPVPVIEQPHLNGKSMCRACWNEQANRSLWSLCLGTLGRYIFFPWPEWLMLWLAPVKTNDASRLIAGHGCHLEDGKCWLSDRACCHGDGVLSRVALVDGDYLEGRGWNVEVCEAGVLQVVKVTLGQSVPGLQNTKSNKKL